MRDLWVIVVFLCCAYHDFLALERFPVDDLQKLRRATVNEAAVQAIPVEPQCIPFSSFALSSLLTCLYFFLQSFQRHPWCSYRSIGVFARSRPFQKNVVINTTTDG